MAILIGVIALAVIPNIQRSRESKDLTTLDNIMSAMNVAAANARLSDGTYTIKYDGTSGALSKGSTTPDDFLDKYKESIGSGTQLLGSSVGKGKDIIGTCTISSGVATIEVKADGADELQYTEKDDGTKTLAVKSVAGKSTSASGGSGSSESGS